MQSSMLNIGDVLENYRIVRLLNRRETGYLYQAVERDRGRPSGIQLFPWPFAGDERVIRRMWKEIAPIHKLDHPNICWVYRAGTAEDRAFLVTDLLDGSSLDYVIGGKPLVGDLVLSYALQIASALEAAHGKGTLHLGLNPANVFVTSLGVKLLDFGLAAAVEAVFPNSTEEVTLAFAGASAGSCTYLSPEQASGVPVDARSDLFSLGAVLYEMATGIPAFSGKKPNQSADRLLQDSPVTPSALNPEVSPELETIILKATAKEREQRYQTASQLIKDLLAIMDVQRLIGLEQFATAEHLLVRQLASDPQDGDAEKTLAHVQRQLSRIERANHIRNLCWQAEEEVISKRYVEAIETYTRAVNVDPSAHALGSTRKKQSQADQERARTMQEIRAKIERLRVLAKTKELPTWIDGPSSGTSPSSADGIIRPANLDAGEVLQSYRIVRILGQRRDRDLYEALDARSESRVAIEVLHGLKDKDAAAHLQDDIGPLRRLKHPNLCAIYETGVHKGLPYIAMEYLAGGNSLENIFFFGEMLSLTAKLEIIRQVCAGIDYAHRNGLTRIDVDPSMVIVLRDGGVKLVGYWLARLKKKSSQTTAAGTVDSGSISHIAPERLLGRRADGRSDIYSTGVLLFQSLGGQLPFSGSDQYLLHQILHDKSPSLREFGNEFPAGLDGILDRSLAKDPAERYQTAGQMAEDLSRVIDGLNPKAEAGSPVGSSSPIPTENKPGAFTQMFGSPGSAEASAPAAVANETRDSSSSGPGSFTRLLSFEPPSAPPPPVAPPAAAGPGLWTQTFEALAKPDAPAAASGPSEFTRILDVSRMREMAMRGGVNATDSAPAAPQQPASTVPGMPSFPVATSSVPESGPQPSPFSDENPPNSGMSTPQTAALHSVGNRQTSEVLDRTLDLAFASPVPVLTPVEILALLRLPTSNSLAELLKQEHDIDLLDSVRSRSFGLEFLHDAAGKLRPVDITMRINAPDFKPARMEKKVRVRPDRDSERQSFLLTPQRTGVLRIEFDVLIDDLTVASQVLKTQSEASDRLTAPATPVVVSVPLSVVVRPRRRRAWILAVAAGVLFATVIAYLLFPHLLFHRPAHGVPLVDAGRGFPKISPAQSAVTLSLPVPHNYALIFATNDYASWPHLTNPIPDADALNQTLKTLYNFQVDELRNPTNEEILAKLTDYLHRTFQPQDQLLVFFSGHGYFDNDLGQGFIVPSNAPPLQNDLGHTKLLAHDTIMRYVNRIPSQHVVLIIDACFAGTLDRKIADSGLRGDSSLDIYAHASLPELLVRKEPKRTRRYFASGGKDFVPDGAPGHHSPFLAALLVTLNQAADRKGYATLDDIQLGLNTVNPEPRWGDIQDENDPGADFILLTPNAVNQLTRPN